MIKINREFLSAVSTFLGVVVALFLPFYLEYRKKRNILQLIHLEFKENKKIINNLFEEYNKNYPEQINIGGNIVLGQEIKLKSCANILSNIQIDNWKNYKHILASTDYKTYIFYQSEYKKIENILEDGLKLKENNFQGFSDKQKKIIYLDIFQNKLNTFFNSNQK